MNLNFSSETFQIIESVIKDEFDRRFDRNPLGDKLQAKLTDAFRLANYRLMSLSLEEAGDYFSANTDAVQESVRLYQDAIFCLSHDPSEKELGKLLAGLDFDHKRFETSNSEYIVPDLFNPVQLSLQQNSIDNDLAIRLLFKAGTGMLLQSQHKRAEDFFSKALQIDRVRPSSDCLYRPCILQK